MDIQIPENARTFIAGQTGSGKTFLAKKLLEDAPRLIVIDSKHNLLKDMHLEKSTHKLWSQFMRGKDARIQVKTPRNLNDRAVMAYCEAIFRRVEMATDCLVYIDEGMHITVPGIDPPVLKGLYTRGREAVLRDNKIIAGNIGVIACSQRPSRIPLFMITESEYKFCFRLMNPDDRKRMSGYMGDAVREIVDDPHGFYYYENGLENAVYVPELKG